MPKVTLYVRDSDTAIWDRARALVTDGNEASLSTLVTDALAELVPRLERERQGEGTWSQVKGCLWISQPIKFP